VLRCYVTNLVKGVCLTEKGMNRLPTIKEIEFWWPHFYREFEEVRPEIVIAMGDLVYRTLCRKGVRARMVKHPRWYESHGAISNNASYDKMLRDYEEAVRSS